MNKFFKIDIVLVVVVLLLITIGLVSIYGVSSVDNTLNLGNFTKQVIAAGIGLLLMVFFTLYDYRVLSSYSTRLYFVGLAILTVVLIIGVKIRGNMGWIKFGAFNFQPVEVVKLILIIFLASFLSGKKNQLGSFTKTITSIILMIFPIALVLKQPDMGSVIIILGIWFGMLLASGIGKKNIMILVLLGMVTFSSSWFFLKDYQKERITNFINPYNDPRGSGYNVIQSIVAVGSGGMWGKGIGHGSQSQLNFLPEKHTDFIFAVIGEELGFLGAAIVLGLFGVLFYRVREIARLSRDNFGYLMAIGIMLMFFSQLLVNVGMDIGIMPVAGVPLPFLSYGGSSLITVLAAVGILQSIYMRRMKTLD